MGLLDPTPPPFDPREWARKPFPIKSKMMCHAWALQGYGAPPGAYLLYALKIAFYVGVWAWCCSWTPGLGDLGDISSWWLHPIAFQKAILWSLMFEILGLGCGSGPLTGRYAPPIGGLLYFLRPGTTKLPLFPRAPLIGGHRRTPLDTVLYAALLCCVGQALVQPVLETAHFVPVVALVAALGVLDRTLFLAARGEHYWVTLVCIAFASNWIAGAKIVQLALWFWAGFSKLNHHFPAVVCVMTSNNPFTRFEWFRRRLYRDFPDDLRPSTMATIMGHLGTALEFSVPLVLVFASGGALTSVGLGLMLLLHLYITSNVPAGVPLEWNVMVVYGGFFLFSANAEISPLSLELGPVAALLLVTCVLLPLLGNLFPRAISFLLAMRYYAGNWAYGVWLFRGDSYRKLDRHLVKAAPWVYDQLERFYGHDDAVGMVGRVMAFRLMHLHGRALQLLLPKAVERVDDYEWLDGEIVAGLVLGWNFGDGHLHAEPFLRAVQDQCGFTDGELRCIFVEAQPLLGRTQAYRIYDACTGLIEQGELPVAQLRTLQPWPPPDAAI